MKCMSKILKKIQNRIIHISRQFFAKTIISMGVIDKMVLIKMDGGICSQMHFYAIGSQFEKKGYLVKYDLSFFRNWGTDLDHKFARNFELIKAFPTIRFKLATRFETFCYKAYESFNDYYSVETKLNYLNAIPPIFLTGYYRDPTYFYKNINQLFQPNLSLLNKESLRVLSNIKERDVPVAIHIRKGDLSSFHPAYGNPIDVIYLNKAIKFIENAVTGQCFYFIFSDEPDWVKENMIKDLHVSNNYQVITNNNAENAFMDMFLISACKHQITSKGSLGKYGGFLCSNPNNIIIVYDDQYERLSYEQQHPNIVFLA